MRIVHRENQESQSIEKEDEKPKEENQREGEATKLKDMHCVDS
jgi:hypothetical protein